MKNQNHSSATPMKPGKKGLNMISDDANMRGINNIGPILYLIENMLFIVLAGIPPGLFRTELNTGVKIRSKETDSKGTTDGQGQSTFQRWVSKNKGNARLFEEEG